MSAATGSAASGVVDVTASKLWGRRGPAPPMPLAHRHDDIEVNLVVAGSLGYLFGGTPVTVPAGHLAVFWAATPHRLVATKTPPADAKDAVSDVCWMHVPLASVLGWGLGERSFGELLQNRPVVVSADVLGRAPETSFDRWIEDLAAGSTIDFALLELQALLRRVLQRHRRDLRRLQRESGPRPTTERPVEPVITMAQYAVSHFHEPISASDLARAAHLHPNYAATIFKQTIGTTPGEYLTQCRVAEAQRLLITTMMTTTEVAHAAGFGSLSSFYAVFGRVCGRAPGEYRRQFAEVLG